MNEKKNEEQFIKIFLDEKINEVGVDINLDKGIVTDMMFLDALSQISQQIISKKTDVLNMIKLSIKKLEDDQEYDSDMVLENLKLTLGKLL